MAWYVFFGGGFLNIGVSVTFRVRCTSVVLGVLLAGAVEADEAREYYFDIPRQNVAAAINEIATQVDALLLFPYEEVKLVETNPVKGIYTVAGALEVLLQNTGLAGSFTSGGVITISSSELTDGQDGDAEMSGKKSRIQQKVAVAIMSIFGAANASGQALPDGETERESRALEEIIVTATKRESAIMDVAISMSVIDSNTIDKKQLVEMGDYLEAMPSVIYHDAGAGRNSIFIRGLATNSMTPTTGTYIDEVPTSDIAVLGMFDPKLVDIERVEVLRGPQGTLYGAGAMGGAVKVVPNRPNLSEFGNSARFSLGFTEEGDASYDVSGTINIPLVDDKFALRATGYYYKVGGVVDNEYPESGVFGDSELFAKDVDEERTSGARIALAYSSGDRFDASLTAFYQETTADGLPESQPLLGDYVQSRGFKEELSDEFGLINLVLNYSTNRFDIVSSTAFIDRTVLQDRDLSVFFGAPLRLSDPSPLDQFIQEVRITSNYDSRLQWLVGAFYSDLTREEDQNLSWFGDDTGLGLIGLPADVVLFDANREFRDDQTAVFVDVTYELNDQWALSTGLRAFEYNLFQYDSATGVFNGGDTLLVSETSGDHVSPKVTLTYDRSDDRLYYATVAEGFRQGVINGDVPSPICDQDLADLGLTDAGTGSDPDTVWNYEVGGKMTLGGGTMNLTGAVFHIDWSDIQNLILLPNCGFTVNMNAGKATSDGVELEFSALLGEQFTLNLAGSYNRAELAEDSPVGATGRTGSKGDSIPGVPEINLQSSLEYFQPMRDGRGFARVDYLYVGPHYTTFEQTKESEVGDYNLVNLSFGFQNDQWSGAFYAQNLLNEKYVMSLDTEINDGRLIYGRPRTIGFYLRTYF